ncbi:GntR family transcriptional regulator [Alkalinema pantanalense CENA528]|uniref:GntR family transcriptional regulator n=1 Tax=Alkalinema pantanalense TaxID=1620705 RepID=UPI003D6DF36D
MALARSRLASLPLHQQISEQLRSDIEAGVYQPGDRLPSEAQLMTQFTVSRITIRRAIANLVQQGLVQSQHGKGVFVSAHDRAIYSLSSPFVWFNEDMVRQGLTPYIQTLVFKAVQPPEAVRQTLALPPDGTHVYLQKKFLMVNQVAAALDITYLVPDLGKTFAAELKRNMTFPVLEQHGISVDRIDALLSCRQADSETATDLGLPLGSPILVYHHTAYSGDRPILYGETLSSGDRLAYSVTLKK